MLDSEKIGTELHNKIKDVFPEFRPFLSEGDEQNSTATFLDLLDSLERENAAHGDSELVSRLNQFRDWVESYPRGDDASNDLLTWYFVSFVEKLLEHDKLYDLAPIIIEKDTLIADKDYFYTWIGAAAYHRALSAFPDGTQAPDLK